MGQSTSKTKIVSRAKPVQAEIPVAPPASVPTVQQPAPPPPAPKELTPAQQFQISLEKYKDMLFELLKAHGMDPKQFVHIVVSEVKRDPKLLEAFRTNPASMFASIIAGAEIGLTPSALHGDFYLIPRRIDNVMTVTPLIGYKGLVSILMRSGQITRIHTECVYEGEEFTPTYGLEPNIHHIPNFELERTSSKIKFVYAVAKLNTGEYQFAVLSRRDIEGIRALSKYNNELYWNDKKDPNKWMLRKVALVQLSKMLPKDYYSKRAISLDTEVEGGAILSIDDMGSVTVKQGNKFASFKPGNVISTINGLPDLPDGDMTDDDNQ